MTTHTSRLLLFPILAFATWACSDSELEIQPKLDDFTLAAEERSEVEAAAASGKAAEGSYIFDQGSNSLSINVAATSFSCGIQVGTLNATVTELTATRMVWTFEDDEGDVTWTRVDAGTSGIEGVWETDEPHLFAVFTSSGSAQIFGDAMSCGEDRARNGDGCYQVRFSGATLALDGDLSDWEAVRETATLRDAAGDYLGNDEGADLRALKVEVMGSSVFVLTQLATAPSTAFQAGPAPNGGQYRVTVRGDNGLSVRQRVAYSPVSEGWAIVDTRAGVAAAVGSDGIEWEVDISSVEGPGFQRVDMVLVESIDCGSGSCEILDGMECAFFDVPR